MRIFYLDSFNGMLNGGGDLSRCKSIAEDHRKLQQYVFRRAVNGKMLFDADNRGVILNHCDDDFEVFDSDRFSHQQTLTFPDQ